VIESESWVFQEFRRNVINGLILDILVDRFGPEARELRDDLGPIEDSTRLRELTMLSCTCADLDAFRAAIHRLSVPHPETPRGVNP
jgi:hypothetical protein